EQTKHRGTARLSRTPLVHASGVKADLGRSHACPQDQALPPAAGCTWCTWPDFTQLSFFAFGAAFSQSWTGHQTGETDSVSVLEVGINGRHDNTGFNRDQVYADERNADPGINDDTFVEYSIQNID